MKKVILLVAFIVVSDFLTAQADISSDKRREIEKMLRLVGMEKLMDQMKTQMLSDLKKQWTEIPDEFWRKFEEKVNMREFLEKIIPLYDKYYSVDDLKAVNKFYESAVGQKVLSTLPQVMQESMKIGQEWGQKLGKEAAREAQAEIKKKR